MKNYPISVLEMGGKVRRYNYKNVIGYSDLAQKYPQQLELEFLQRQAATKIAHEFVAEVLRGGYIQHSDEPEGRVLKFTAIALRYDELLDLLYQAFVEGQTDGMRRGPRPWEVKHD